MGEVQGSGGTPGIRQRFIRRQSLYEPFRQLATRVTTHSLLRLAPSQQHLLRLLSQPVCNVIDGLIDRSARLGRQGDERRVPLGHDVVLLHVFQERSGRLDDVGVEEDLVDDWLDGGVLEEGVEVVDGEAEGVSEGTTDLLTRLGKISIRRDKLEEMIAVERERVTHNDLDIARNGARKSTK